MDKPPFPLTLLDTLTYEEVADLSDAEIQELLDAERVERFRVSLACRRRAASLLVDTETSTP